MRHIRKSNLLAVPYYKRIVSTIVDIANFKGESAHSIHQATGVGWTSVKAFMNGSGRIEPASLQKILDYLNLDIRVCPKGQRSLPF